MNKETLSKAVGDINSRHISEAMNYTKRIHNRSNVQKALGRPIIAIAACLCLVLGISIFQPFSTMTITAHDYGTNEKITSVGTVLSTGKINNNGSMTGEPLQFYIQGKNIETIRFSVRNQWIDFVDWTEKRDEYGTAKNFTINYGPNEKEYYYLVVYWEPKELYQVLNDKNVAVTDLTKELREDMIVLEITFNNGKKMAKAIHISLQDDGNFYVQFKDYKITELDKFVHQKDSKPIRRDILYAQGSDINTENIKEAQNYSSALSSKDLDTAKMVAHNYYNNQSIWKIETISATANDNTLYQNEGIESEYNAGNIIIFDVIASRDGEKANRSISVARNSDNSWIVINEGF